jgi:sarcosine oxidase subunit alpha
MSALDFEGRPVRIREGDTVASALFRAGVRTFTRSLKHHRRRGPYCLSGDCASCLLTVDGQPGVRSCTTEAHDGMRVEREGGFPNAQTDLLAIADRLHPLMPVGFYSKTFIRPRSAWPLAERAIRAFTGLGRLPKARAVARKPTRNLAADVLVVGAGIAGLAAAAAAAGAGGSVVLAEEGAIGDGLAPGPTLDRIRALERAVRGLGTVELLERHAAIGVYQGPFVPLIGDEEVVRVEASRVVVATGAHERHLPFPGNDLPGVWLGRGAIRMAVVHGVPIGRRAVVVVGTTEAIEHVRALHGAGVEVLAVASPDLVELLPGGIRVAADATLVAAQGDGCVRSVTLATGEGERRVACDGLVLSAGRDPRDALLRMSVEAETLGAGDVVWPGCTPDEAEASGRSAGGGEAPEPREQPRAWSASGGYVCLCEDVTVDDLEGAWAEGWRSSEILKRYTTATMGPCRGALCGRLLASFAGARAPGGATNGRTTARPPARPVALEDLAAGIHETIEKRTALHERHVELGGRLDWSGAWRRPLDYGDPAEEYAAVRERVGVMDVGTLAKFLVSGRDATALVDRVFPCRVDDLEPGRARYLLALDEAGYVMDDGMLCALGDGAFVITSTSGGADGMEAWLRNWVDRLELHAHLVNRTSMLGAFNVAGPRARELLLSLGAEGIEPDAMPHMTHREITVAGVPCHAIRVGFVGEVSFELHHPRSRGVELWDALLDAGAGLGIRPHGLDTLEVLRLEKGHPYLGQDTLPDDHPGKLGLGWAVAMDKPGFVGKVSLERMSSLPLERKLVGLEFDGEPQRGVPLYADDRVVGRVTSCARSPALGREIGLGWLRAVDGRFPSDLRADGVIARVAHRVFYDPEGARLRA